MEKINEMKMKITGKDINKEKYKKIAKEIGNIFLKTFIETGKIIDKYQKEESIELSMALTSNLANFILSLSPKRATELCIEIAHTIMLFDSKQINKEEINKMTKDYFNKKPSEYIG